VTLARLNLVSAFWSLLGSMVLLLIAAPSALIWLAASVIWVVMAGFTRRRQPPVDFAARRMARRFRRLLLFS